MARRVLKKNTLRTKLETPDIYDRDENGNVVYPLAPDGTVGGAYTYNAQHMGDAPPPQEVVEDDDSDWEDLATAAALALAAKRHKENLKKAADTQHGRLADAAREEHRRLDAAAKAEHANLNHAAKLTHEQRVLDVRAAQARLGSAALDAQTTGMAPIIVPQGIIDDGTFRRAPMWENFTNMPLAGQEAAGGYVPDAPTGNDYAVASGPLPSGVEEGAHGASERTPYAGEHTHEALMISARHARQQARGAANQAIGRRAKALGLIAERRAKGLPTEDLEREAGWAYQQEQRARGMEQENARIEIGQRYREMEDIGAERALEQQRAGAKRAREQEKASTEYTEQLRKNAEAYQEAERASLERRTQAENDTLAASPVVSAEQVLTPEAPAQPAPVAVDEEVPAAVARAPAEEMPAPEGAHPQLDPAMRRVVAAGGPLPPRRTEHADTYSATRAITTKAPAGIGGGEGDAYGVHPFLPTDTPYLAGRPTLNEWDAAYQLNFNAEEDYNRREDRIAHRQNEMDMEPDDDPIRKTADTSAEMDPMRSAEAQVDANAPFRDDDNRSPAPDEDYDTTDADSRSNVAEIQAAVLELAGKNPNPGEEAPEPPAPK